MTACGPPSARRGRPHEQLRRGRPTTWAVTLRATHHTPWPIGLAALLAAGLSGCGAEVTSNGSGSGATAGSATGSGATGMGGSAPGIGGTGTGGSGPGGSGGISTDPDVIAEACAAKLGVLDTGISKLRRMTRIQLDNTVRDLLGIEAGAKDVLPPDEKIGPFESNATAPVTELLVQQHKELSEAVAAAAATNLGSLAACDLASDTTMTCASAFISEFGRRAFRRPLADDELGKYLGLYTLGHGFGGAERGVRVALEAMLQAPSFIYHADTGVGGLPSATPVPLDPYNLASRLSYFLFQSMPDDQLLALAANGTLSTPAVVLQEVQRMLQDPRSNETVATFHRQWLGVSELLEVEKDAAAFPSYTPEVAQAMLSEQAWFTQAVVLQGDGLLRTLFTADYGFPSGPLFEFYGVSAPAGHQPGQSVIFPAGQRSGLLTQAAFLTKHAKRNETSPVHRGIVVLENLICQTIQPPPANVDTSLPPPSEATTTRQRFAQHEADPVCAGCHADIDAIGLAFENYDGIGRYRTTEGLNPIDATGVLSLEHDDLDGAFVNALELSARLGQSETVAGCVARQWFRFSLGRTESQSDVCSMHSILEGFASSGRNVRALIAEIAQSEAFLHVRSTAEAGP